MDYDDGMEALILETALDMADLEAERIAEEMYGPFGDENFIMTPVI